MKPSTIDWPVLLRDFRRARGMKQDAAAEYFGVSQASISRWENGASAPTVAMRNKLFSALRRLRSPLDSQGWLETFRRIPTPGLVSTECRRLCATTDFLAQEIGVPREELERLSLDELFEGEAQEVSRRIRLEKAFSGRVASYEGCLRLDVSSHIRKGVRRFCHFVGWPHFADGGLIVNVHQGRFIDAGAASEIRKRMGGPLRFTYVD